MTVWNWIEFLENFCAFSFAETIPPSKKEQQTVDIVFSTRKLPEDNKQQNCFELYREMWDLD